MDLDEIEACPNCIIYEGDIGGAIYLCRKHEPDDVKELRFEKLITGNWENY